MQANQRTLNEESGKQSSMPGAVGVLQRKCDCGNHANGECESCRNRPNGTLQRAAIQPTSVSAVPEIVHEVLRSPGRPLDSATRGEMQSKFAYDLSQVRVHTDQQAADSARAVDALAYTVGNNVVFGSGQFQPRSVSGQQLLAHEITHVIQQRTNAPAISLGVSAIDPSPHAEAEARNAEISARTEPSGLAPALNGPSLQRAPKGGSSTSKAPPHITNILVDQNTKQQVTATFSDGSTKSDDCSTGKGHCCFDDSAGAALGGACSASRSNQTDNNCTPVGDFTVTTKVPKTAGGIEFWTQFHDAKQVALHKYWPVDGTPLSHGCVRLKESMAKIIFEGSRERVTKVKVAGLAKPKCGNTTLQAEWEGDFRSAGSKPPDGTTINPSTNKKYTKKEIAREKHYIEESRKEMKSALGVDEKGLDAEIASWVGGAPILSKIPRCVPALTVEEQKVPSAQASGFLPADPAKTSSAFAKKLAATKNAKSAEAVVKQSGEDLWQAAAFAAKGGGAGTDDRQLYWTRLMMTTELRKWNPSWVSDADGLRRLQTRLLQLFEQNSRGMTTATFPSDPDKKRILVSGFDPFGFPNQGDIRQSNLSGATALALDGETLTEGTASARVESSVFPVRYADFNEGMVENYLRPKLTATNPPHLVMSISQGSAKFELEEFAGRRRSTDTFADNLGEFGGGGSHTKPLVPPGVGTGPEFLPHTVPAATLAAMRGAAGRKGAITEETEVKDLPPGATQARDRPKGPGSTPESKKTPGIAVEGSGGGFLSNEIFYRNSLLQTTLGTKVPMIHMHTPTLPPGVADARRNGFIDTTRKILRAAVPRL
jgi:pyrrolidone-carboxylate peptidase